MDIEKGPATEYSSIVWFKAYKIKLMGTCGQIPLNFRRQAIKHA